MTCEQEMCDQWNGHTCVCAAIEGDPEEVEGLSDHINELMALQFEEESP